MSIVEKITPPCQANSPQGRTRRFQFQKRRHLFIRVHNETLSVVAVRVSNEERWPVGIHCCNAAPTPTSFAELVSDDFPRLKPSPRAPSPQRGTERANSSMAPKNPRTRNGRETEESRCWSMKTLKLLSLVGVTSIALAQAEWAAAQGLGAGGSGSGGFGGGNLGQFPSSTENQIQTT